MTTLLDELRQAAAPPMPKGFSPGITYSGRTPSEITTPWMDHELSTEADFHEAVKAMGVPLAPGLTLELVEARFNQAAWHRDAGDRGAKDSAYTAPMWLYRFKVVPLSLRADGDLAKLAVEARKAVRGRGAPTKVATLDTKVVNLSDFQTGKVDELGGTKELLERSEAALAEVVRDIRREKPSEIVLVDPGDSTEGFESSPNANRTNDLQQTEQIRVWRRILWRWIAELARLTDDLKVVSVPSNHCRVRSGKATLGPPDDDWGLEVLSQVADMAAVNPEAFGHVTFHVPNKYEEFVVLTLAGGQTLGVVHGHQVGNPNGLADWVKKQGRRAIAQCDVVIAGHFHHLRVVSFGDGQTLFICPANDSGSSWYTNISGERSRAGVLTVVVDEAGWRDMKMIWTS